MKQWERQYARQVEEASYCTYLHADRLSNAAGRSLSSSTDTSVSAAAPAHGVLITNSLSAFGFASPINILSWTKTHPIKHRPISGTNVMKTTCIPLIFASNILDVHWG
jgi:hypothetical protein